jgi:hypothetical protein
MYITLIWLFELERGVVGEFGLGFDDNKQKDDGIDELIAAINGILKKILKL